MTTVLFTCSGMRVDVVTAFKDAGATTVAADADPLAPTLYHADEHDLVPRVDDPAYIPALAEIVRSRGVDLVVPVTDIDSVLLAQRRDELGAPLLLPDTDIVVSTADKYAAHELFVQHGIPSPPSWLPEDVPEDARYPLLVKSRYGYGSRNIYRAEDRRQLDFFLGYTPAESFVQQCCLGEEFSIDVLCDFEGRCLNAIPRTMILSKGGESIQGRTIKDPELIEAARQVAESLPLKGPATIQVFREDGEHRVTDVNPRFGGAFPLPLAAGGNYPELVLALVSGERPEPMLGEFREGVAMTRFYSSLALEPQTAS
ncbi:MAG TPA: ATP-grasp domain-containing protein [Gaiellaceae bacterium]